MTPSSGAPDWIDSPASALAAVNELIDYLGDVPDHGRDLLQAVVGELHRADQEIRAASAKYRSLVEQIPAIVYIDVVDESMATTYVSPQIEPLLGISQAEYVDDPDLWVKRLHPEDRDRALAAYLEGRDRGEPFTFEYRLIAGDGRAVWFRDSAVIVRDSEGHPEFLQGVMLDITERKRAEEELSFLAFHDRLTGLPNRAMFEELLGLAMARARRHDLAIAVITADIDDFKLVNDSLGHETGDELIRRLAERLQEATRETDLVARPGGDEFLILLADLERGRRSIAAAGDAPIHAAETVALRIQDALRTPFELGGTEVYASASLGIAVFPTHARDATELLKNADAAMYRSKQLTPGGYAICADESARALGRLALSTRLRKAVENQNWTLHYQPVVNLADGSFTGVEALIRWADPNGGLVPPGEFIPLAEEMGLIETIGDWVVEELAVTAAGWRTQGLEPELSFNLSPRQLWQADLASGILSRLAGGHVDPGRVVVEITESAAMTEPDRTIRILEDLRAHGLRLAIDDFGTGYSSLSRLKDMPVDVLKIDRTFVRGVAEDKQAGSMVQAVVQLARGLGMTPLAEGVETESERDFLLEHGFQVGQGFLFARPMPAAELLALHRRSGMRVIEGGLAG